MLHSLQPHFDLLLKFPRSTQGMNEHGHFSIHSDALGQPTGTTKNADRWTVHAIGRRQGSGAVQRTVSSTDSTRQAASVAAVMALDLTNAGSHTYAS